ncbi:MAG: glycosyltransferase [Candidatus Omnitrophota bacterium]
MIYVTVSGCSKHFLRLLKKIDEIAAEIEEEVIMQTGTDYVPKNAGFKKYFSRKETNQLMQKAALIVAHAGIGTIISAVKLEKPIVIVPRLKKYGEHFNDHQLEICKALENQKGIKVVYDLDCLKEALMFREKTNWPPEKRQNLIIEIRNFLNSFS